MAGHGEGNSSRRGGASASVAATAIDSEAIRFPQSERRRRWGQCWGALSCFGKQKGGKRIVPASRIPEGNASANRANRPQPVGLTNQTATIVPSLLAPPSSPASFSNSALPSTAQSPSCFLSPSANSPEGPSSTMFATGPYAHDTQLVSPPVFSTFTTEPSTAPLTPPPELTHPTTPSSPDVPYAQFLSSSMDLKSTGKSCYVTGTDLQATYPLYPESPASSLISPVSRTSGDGLSSSFPDQESPAQWGANPCSRSSRLFGLDATATKNFILPQDSNFFCPATSAQFYLDQAQQTNPLYPHCAGRLSLSVEADTSAGGNVHQNRHSKNCKAEVEEIEAYRASFGFSADEIITTPQYVEISDVMEDSFTMKPFVSSSPFPEECTTPEMTSEQKTEKTQMELLDYKILKSASDHAASRLNGQVPPASCNGCEDKLCRQPGEVLKQGTPDNHVLTDDEEIFSKMDPKISKKYYRLGLSSSDAEIDYGRGRSLRGGRGDFAWRE